MIVAISAMTGGINLSTTRAELREFGLTPGAFHLLSESRMKEIHSTLETRRGRLPLPRGGGSVANTIDFLSRAGMDCGLIGLAGNDVFGKAFLSYARSASLKVLLELEEGAGTGYDFYLIDEDGLRTILLTHGANSLLSPDRIEPRFIENAELLILDGSVLGFGTESKSALEYCIQLADQSEVPYVLTLASTGIVQNHLEFFRQYSPGAEWVAGNLEQACSLFGLSTEAILDELKPELAKTSIHTLITLDKNGAYARFDGEDYHILAREVQVSDSTGAGDNFLAGFLISRLKGLSIPESLAMGNFIASKVIQQEAARLPQGYDIRGLVEEAFTKC